MIATALITVPLVLAVALSLLALAQNEAARVRASGARRRYFWRIVRKRGSGYSLMPTFGSPKRCSHSRRKHRINPKSTTPRNTPAAMPSNYETGAGKSPSSRSELPPAWSFEKLDREPLLPTSNLWSGLPKRHLERQAAIQSTHSDETVDRVLTAVCQQHSEVAGMRACHAVVRAMPTLSIDRRLAVQDDIEKVLGHGPHPANLVPIRYPVRRCLTLPFVNDLGPTTLRG